MNPDKMSKLMGVFANPAPRAKTEKKNKLPMKRMRRPKRSDILAKKRRNEPPANLYYSLASIQWR
jgi:hypothetical protein